MHKPNALPFRDEKRGTLRHRLQERRRGVLRISALWVEMFDDVIHYNPHQLAFFLSTGRRQLERSKPVEERKKIWKLVIYEAYFYPVRTTYLYLPNKRPRNAANDRSGLFLDVAIVEHVPHNNVTCGYQGQSAGGRDAQGSHGFGSDVFAERRAQDGATVGKTRIGCPPGALELQLPADAGGGVQDLAQANRTSITQLACENVKKKGVKEGLRGAESALKREKVPIPTCKAAKLVAAVALRIGL
jgi:hypothetical protein